MCICIFRHCKCPVGEHTHHIPLKVTILAISAYAFAYALCISLFGLMGAQIHLQVFLMYTLTKSIHVLCILLAMYLCPFMLSGCPWGCTLHMCFAWESVRKADENGLCLSLCMYQQPLVCMYLCVCMSVRACMHASAWAQCSRIVGAACRKGRERGY